MSEEQPLGPALMLCPHCDSTVPQGHFCGHCGAHLSTADPSRRHAFAAMPNEPVVHFNLISTLFPHLPHRRSGPFRWALGAGVVFVLLLVALSLYAPATAAATPPPRRPRCCPRSISFIYMRSRCTPRSRGS